MKLPRRTFLHLAAGVAALPMVSRIARASYSPGLPATGYLGPLTGAALASFASREISSPFDRRRRVEYFNSERLWGDVAIR